MLEKRFLRTSAFVTPVAVAIVVSTSFASETVTQVAFTAGGATLVAVT
jgi:hypothetical protein